MTAQESRQLAALADQVARLLEQVACVREDVAALGERITAQADLRLVNGRRQDDALAALRRTCDERHERIDETLAALSASDRRTYGTLAKLQGMAAPAAIFVAIISLILSVLH